MINMTIVQADMYERDERALKLLRSKQNRTTKRAEIKIGELAQALSCHRDTASRIVHRLAFKELVKIHATRGRNGADIEVLTFAEH